MGIWMEISLSQPDELLSESIGLKRKLLWFGFCESSENKMKRWTQGSLTSNSGIYLFNFLDFWMDSPLAANIIADQNGANGQRCRYWYLFPGSSHGIHIQSNENLDFLITFELRSRPVDIESVNLWICLELPCNFLNKKMMCSWVLSLCSTHAAMSRFEFFLVALVHNRANKTQWSNQIKFWRFERQLSVSLNQSDFIAESKPLKSS